MQCILACHNRDRACTADLRILESLCSFSIYMYSLCVIIMSHAMKSEVTSAFSHHIHVAGMWLAVGGRASQRAVSSQRLHPASNLEDLLPRVHRQVGVRLHLRRLHPASNLEDLLPRVRRRRRLPRLAPKQILCEGPVAASHLLGGRLTSEGSEALIGARTATPGCVALHYYVRKSGARAWAAWVTHRVALFREHLNIGSHVG